MSRSTNINILDLYGKLLPQFVVDGNTEAERNIQKAFLEIAGKILQFDRCEERDSAIDGLLVVRNSMLQVVKKQTTKKQPMWKRS